MLYVCFDHSPGVVKKAIYISHMVGSDWLFFSNVGCMCLYQLSLGFYHNYLYSKQTKICQDDDHHVLEEQLKNFSKEEKSCWWRESGRAAARHT